MAAAVVSFFTYVNGRHLQASSALEPIFLTVSVSSNGTDQGTKITCVSGNFDFNGKSLVNVVGGSAAGQVLTWDQLGVSNGIASLDSSGHIPLAQNTLGSLEWRGTYNASTNTPTLADGTGTNGYFYRVNVAGTQNFGSGSQTFVVGDWVVYNGSIWQLAHSGSDIVQSVNGFTGTIVLTTDNITQGTTNLYYTATQARTDILASSVVSTDTTHAPTGSAVFAAIAAATPAPPSVSLTNGSGSTVTALQFAWQSAFGTAMLLSTASAANQDSVYLVVKDASIAASATGNYYLPGQIITGFPASSFTANQPVYASKTTPGSFQQNQTGFVTGDIVVKLGKALTATSLIFQPEFQYTLG